MTKYNKNGIFFAFSQGKMTILELYIGKKNKSGSTLFGKCAQMCHPGWMSYSARVRRVLHQLLRIASW